MELVDPQAKAWLAFRAELERGIGIPLAQYKEPQMKRRLASIMTRRSFSGWEAFTRAIRDDKELLVQVRDSLTINVSEFFRQADRFLELQRTILPGLLRERRRLKIWSAGCSIGCEPYTISIILNEIDPRGDHTVLATDVDVPILERARRGDGYIASDVRAVPPALLQKYFRTNGTTYAVTDQVKRRVKFQRHDLLSDPYPTDVDVVLCRNVVIYFTEDAKRQIYAGFAWSLKPGGFLFVGGSEMLLHSQEFGFRTVGTSMYERRAA